MKTATITFHAPNNNGSFLQAYALQKVLVDEFGVENKIIDYQSDIQIKQYSVFRPVKGVRDIVKNTISLFHFNAISKRNKNFEDMRREYLKMTERCSSVEAVTDIANRYDLVLVGSDQIWNTTAPDFSLAYLLPNVSTKKVAFSVSLGTNAKETEIGMFKEYFRSFYALSIREESAKTRFEKETGCCVKVTIDPTLLLDADDYRHLISEERLIKNEYVFFYSINYDSEAMKVAKNMANKLGLRLVTVFTSFHTITSKKYGMRIQYSAGPRDFLNLMNNAKLVITNSFHGTAFSIILNKPFYYVARTINGQLQRDDRIDSLIDKLNLQQCRVGINMMPSELPAIDWNSVTNTRKELKEYSKEYLAQTIGTREESK